MTQPNPHSKPPGSCALGYCRAPSRPRSKYCSVEHGKLARDEQDAQAQARRDVNAHLNRIARGEAPPIPHVGVFTTTQGVVLSGDAVREVRTLLTTYRRTTVEFEKALRRPGASLADLIRTWQDTVLDAEQRVLTHIDRLLPPTQVQPPEQTSRPR